MSACNPSLYQINTRVVAAGARASRSGGPRRWTTSTDALPRRHRRPRGSQWVWFLGVWQTGPAGRAVSRSNPKLVEECRRVLPDLRDEDITGSPFAIVAYRVAPTTSAATRRWRGCASGWRAAELKLLLDFVPNHTAPDHPWVDDAPGVLRPRQRGRIWRAQPQNYARVETRARRTQRDPRLRPRSLLRRLAGHVPAQLPARRLPRGADRRAGRDRRPLRRRPLRHGDAAAAGDHPAHLGRPRRARPTARRPRTTRSGPRRSPPSSGGTRSSCSSPRSTGTWSGSCSRPASTTPTTSAFTIGWSRRRGDAGARAPDGRSGAFRIVRCASSRTTTSRARRRRFPPAMHRAAAVVALLARGLRFIHEGQLEGRKVHVSMHLGRRPGRAGRHGPAARSTCGCSSACGGPRLHDGEWRLWTLPARRGPATRRTSSSSSSSWQSGERRLLIGGQLRPIAGRSATSPSACRGCAGRDVRARRSAGRGRLPARGDDLAGKGLYLDMPAWGHHVFAVSAV